jgi:hypothetical protein
MALSIRPPASVSRNQRDRRLVEVHAAHELGDRDTAGTGAGTIHLAVGRIPQGL